MDPVKLKEFFYMLGLRPSAKTYGYEIREQVIKGKVLRYAQWLHPRAYSVKVADYEVDRLTWFLKEGDVAIDIGAHTGDTTMPMAIAVGPKGCVLAFEANKYVFATLEANSKLNQEIGKIYAYNLAVTEENRPYEFSYNDPGFMNGGAVEKTRSFRRGDFFRQTVQGVRLEDFLKDKHAELVHRIRYIKIDAEGSDLPILKSMRELLLELKPIVQAEVMQRTPASYRYEMFDFLTELGYHIRRVGPSETHEEISREEMLESDSFDLLCIHRSEVALLQKVA